jgi:hypothetical protein
MTAKPLTDAELMRVFEAQHPEDAAIIRMIKAGADVDAVNAIGARSFWRRFKQDARAVEAAVIAALRPEPPAGVAVPDRLESMHEHGLSIFSPAKPPGVALPSVTDMQFKLIDAKNALQHAADHASPEVAEVYRKRALDVAEVVSALAAGVETSGEKHE